MSTSSDMQSLMNRYGIVGRNEALREALATAVLVAPTDLSVLIQGESGVGKEVIPRIIHDHSQRRGKTYIAINCGAIPEGTIDSELFGHEKGAFTSAIGEHEGFFGAADGGTLFLDEVGELPLSTQARLLRVLETGEYLRVGSSTPRKTNVRIVAATNVDIPTAIKQGRFREDLYYRLSTINIQIPPLRKRQGDAVLLFKKFALDTASRYNIPEPIRLTPEAEAVVNSYKWPGNIRQLRNITEQLSILSESRSVTPEMLAKLGITPNSDDDTGIATVGGSTSGGQHDYEQEIKILAHAVFELRSEVQELKEKLTFQLPKRLSTTTHSTSETWRNATSCLPSNAITTSANSLQKSLASAREHFTERLKPMESMNRRRPLLLLLLAVFVTTCTVSYRFNGASIDYTTTKTIQIDNFPIRSAYVWAPMQSIFQNRITEVYLNQTKLRQVKKNGDLQLAGEIVAFDQFNKSISSEGYSSQVQLKMTVNVRFVNNKKHTDDFERQFTATSEFDASQQLNAVQEELVTQMTKDIVDQIFNATVANW